MTTHEFEDELWRILPIGLIVENVQVFETDQPVGHDIRTALAWCVGIFLAAVQLNFTQLQTE